MVQPKIDIDDLLKKEIEREQYRKDYNERPDVKEKRKAYNIKKGAQSKVAKLHMDGKIDRDQATSMLEQIEAGDMKPDVPGAEPNVLTEEQLEEMLKEEDTEGGDDSKDEE